MPSRLRSIVTPGFSSLPVAPPSPRCACASFSWRAFCIASVKRAMTLAGEAGGTGAMGVAAAARAGFEGTVRRSGIGGTGGTGPARVAGGRAFGGVPTGLRMAAVEGAASAMPLVDWVAAPSGPEGLSIGEQCRRFGGAGGSSWTDRLDGRGEVRVGEQRLDGSKVKVVAGRGRWLGPKLFQGCRLRVFFLASSSGSVPAATLRSVSLLHRQGGRGGGSGGWLGEGLRCCSVLNTRSETRAGGGDRELEHLNAAGSCVEGGRGCGCSKGGGRIGLQSLQRVPEARRGAPLRAGGQVGRLKRAGWGCGQ